MVHVLSFCFLCFLWYRRCQVGKCCYMVWYCRWMLVMCMIFRIKRFWMTAGRGEWSLPILTWVRSGWRCRMSQQFDAEKLRLFNIQQSGTWKPCHIGVMFSPFPPTPSKPRNLTGINENAHVSIDVTGITTFPGWGTELDRWFRGEALDTSISIPSPHRYQQWSTECLYATSQDETSQWLCQQAIHRINRWQFELVVSCGLRVGLEL